MVIGVLALQGAFREHIKILEKLSINAEKITFPEQLSSVDGFIIPGGESTTISKLMSEKNFIEPIQKRYAEGMGIFGTCAGMIVLAKDVTDGEPALKLMDITVKRNAFGRQVDSFEDDIHIEEIGSPKYRAVFIRAPWIEDCNGKVKILASYNGNGILAVQDRMLVSAFHPELTSDTRIHELFINMLKNQ